MAGRPRDIGTRAESAIVKYLTANGFPHAERRAMRGTKDVGDITGTLGLVWESKGGHAAWNASDHQIEAWLAETELERANADEHLGILVVARRQKNVRDWWAVMWLDQLIWLAGIDDGPLPGGLRVPVRTTLAHVVQLLRRGGYGDPANDLEETA